MCADKLCAYIVAIYSLLEAAGSVALGVIAILMIECILPPEVPDSSTSVNLVENFLLSFFRQYFYTQDKCSPLNYTIFPEYNQSIVANPTQTQGWLIGYLIDNSLLLLGSLCLLCGIAARKKWLINIYMSTMSSVILYDTVLTVVYGLDISVAIDPSKTNFTFFTISVFPGISNLPGPIDIDTGVDTGTILLVNTILIMVYFSRFVIFFIFNIVCYFVARAVGSKMIKPKATVAPYPETQRNAPPQQNPYPSHQTEDPHFHQPLQRQFYPQSHPYPHPIPQGLAPRLNPVYSEIFDSGHTGYASAPPGSYYNPGFATGENMSKTRMSPEPVRIPDKDTKMLRQQDLAASSPPAYQLPAVDYDIVDNKPDSHYGNKNSGFSDIDSIGSNPTSPVRRSSSDISRSRPRRTSNSSVSSEAVAPELKGQLPWSYVRPEQLPTRGSKGLREFYINKQKKEGVMGKLDAPQESDEEDYDKRDIVPSCKYDFDSVTLNRFYVEVSSSSKPVLSYSQSVIQNLNMKSLFRFNKKRSSKAADRLCTKEFRILNYNLSDASYGCTKEVEDDTTGTFDVEYDPVARTLRFACPELKLRKNSEHKENTFSSCGTIKYGDIQSYVHSLEESVV